MAKTPSGVFGTPINLSTTRLFILDENFPQLSALDGHRMEVDDPETTDEVSLRTMLWNVESLRFEPHTVQIISEQIDGVTATITIPAYEYSRLEEIAEGGDMPAFVSIRQGSSYDKRYARVLRVTAPLSAIVDADVWSVENFEAIDEPEGKTTTASGSNYGRMFPMTAREVNSIATSSLYAVLFTYADSAQALKSGYTPKDILVGGLSTNGYLGVGSSSSDSIQDRWDTLSAISNSIGAGNIVTSLVGSNGVYVGTWADDPDPATATDGGTFSYVNGTVTLGTSISTPMYGCAAIDGDFVFVGKGGVVYTSDSLTPATLTQVTHAVTSEHMMAVAGDPDNDVFYIVTSSGSLLTLVASSVSDISAYLPGSPSDLRSVAVLGDDHIAVGGANGYYAEHLEATNASASNPYTQSTLNGGSGTVRAIAGETTRVLCGVDTKLFERSLLTINDVILQFQELTIDGGAPSGNITDIKMLTRYNEPNFAVAVTASAEILYLNPQHSTR